MKFILLAIFLLCFHTNLSAQNVAATDSLQNEIKNHSGDEKAALLIQLSYKVAGDNADSALALVTQSIEVAKTKEAKAKSYFQKAMLHRYMGDENAFMAALDSTYNLAVKINDTLLAAQSLHFKQILLSDLGKYNEALQVGYTALTMREQLANSNELLNALLQIGYTYDRMGEYQKAIEWYEKGLKIEGVTNENYIGRNYGLFGIAYDELGDYEKAISYNLSAIEHFKKIPNSTYLHTWYSNLGNTYLKVGKLDLAEKYTLLALENKDNILYVAMVNLGNIYLKKGELNKAEVSLKKTLQLLEKTEKLTHLSEAYFILSELYKKKGDYKTALQFFEKYNATEEKRLSIEKVKQFNQLTVEYETAEKEKQILSQKNKIAANELRLKNRNQWILGLSSLAVIFALIGFLVYKQQALKNIKQKRENELQLALGKTEHKNKLQEQRLSISRDLHDNIGAQLSFIISAIDTIKFYVSKQDRALNQKLDNIGTFAKETIQELRDTIWAMNKSEISLDDLQSRIANFIEKAKQAYPQVNINAHIENKEGVFQQFSAIQGLNIYRILQEAINNALKYAAANSITIEAKQINNQLQFIIKDDGKGFVENEIEPGNGLLNMRKRALNLGGELVLQSSQNEGTSIYFTANYV